MLLGIDTCGAIGSIALADWDGETAEVLAQRELAGKTFSAQLIPSIRELLSEQSAMPHDLKAIIVVNGPGSFTGVRIGVSAAKGLAEALQIPVVALSRLMLLARKAETLVAALDAGRGECYFGNYKSGKSEEMLLTADEIREYSTVPIAICEPGLTGNLASGHLTSPPDATDAIRAAAARLRATEYDDIATLDGNYVRRTPAELFARPASSK